MAGLPRILFCLPSFPPDRGGSQALFGDLVRLWAEQGGEAVVYTTTPGAGRRSAPPPPEETGRRDEAVAGVTVRRFPAVAAAAPRLRGKLLAALSRAGPLPWRAALGFPHVLTRGYRAALRRETSRPGRAFRLVVGGVLPHTHVLEPAMRFAARAGLPALVVPLLHTGLLGSRPRRQVAGPGAGRLLASAAGVAALTGAEVEPLQQLGAVARRIRVLPIGLQRVDPPGVAGRFAAGLGLRTPYLLQAGALSGDKGTLDLIAAQGLRVAAGDETPLVLLGRPEGDVERRLAAEPAAVRGTIHLHRDPDPARWHDAVAGAAALVHPSRADSFGRVLLESWRAAVPVVVADSGGPPHLVAHGSDGLVVPAGDPPALAKAMDSLLSHPSQARKMGAAGRQCFISGHTWERLFPSWQALFRETAECPPVSRAETP
jgi:glycosyltransferase involved in cell wall biosynthesis